MRDFFTCEALALLAQAEIALEDYGAAEARLRGPAPRLWRLRAHLDQLPLSHELATVKCDLDLETSLDELEIQPADKEALYDWYRELEFGTWLRQLQGVRLSDTAWSTNRLSPH